MMDKPKKLKRFRFVLVCAFLIICAVIFVRAQDDLSIFPDKIVEELNFENQQVGDIFQILAKISQTTIIVAKDISGFKTYHFRSLSIKDIFMVLLNDNGLTYSIINNVVYVNKQKSFTVTVTTNGLISIKSSKASLTEIIYDVFVKMNKVIMFKSLKDLTVDLSIQNYSFDEFIDFLKTQYQFQFQPIKNGFLVSQPEDQQKQKSPTTDNGIKVDKQNGKYTVAVQDGQLFDLLKTLFENEGLNYSIILEKELKIKSFLVQNETFANIMELLKARFQFDYVLENRFITVYTSMVRNDFLVSKIFVTYTLKNMTIARLKANLPPELNLFDGLRLSDDLNTVSIFGFPDDVKTILDIIKGIDQNNVSRMEYVQLYYISLDDFKKALPDRYKTRPIIYLDKYSGLIIDISPEELPAFREFIKEIDRELVEHAVYVNNMKIDDFLKGLPDDYKKMVVSSNPDGNFVIVRGPKKDVADFCGYAAKFDADKKQIRYHLLIVQAREGTDESFDPQFSTNGLSLLDATFLNKVATLFTNPSLQALSDFGSYFSLKLLWSISRETSKIDANSIVYAINNTQIEFDNTSTYRYRESKYDETTKTWIDTGVIREISIGFLLTFTGTINNDDEIVLDLNGKISRVTNASAIGTNSTVLPITTEKVIKNKFITKNNIPLLVVSYKEEYETITENKTPILGDIPILNLLFKTTVTTKEVNNFLVYLLPQIVTAPPEEESFNAVYGTFGLGQ